MSICKIRLHYSFCVNFTRSVIKGVPKSDFVIETFYMKRLPLILAISVICAACNEQPKEKEFVCPTSLEDVEFFYRDNQGGVVHADPKCAEKCIYWEHVDSRDPLCAKCISPELAKQIKGKD